MKYSLFLFVLFLSCFFARVGGADAEGLASPYASLKCQLRVSQRVFKVGEPLTVQFLVRNEHYNSVNLQLSSYFYYNFRFVIRSLKYNKIVDEDNYFYAEKIDNAKSAHQYKSINLEKYEFYGQSLALNRYYNLREPGHYIIQGFFSPAPQNIRPGIEIPTQIIHIELQDTLSQQTQNAHVQNAPQKPVKTLTNPYDTVAFVLHARQEKDWSGYFQYMNLNSLIKQYPQFYARYQDAPLRAKSTVMNDFKDYMKGYFSTLGLKTLKSFDVYKSIIQNDRKQARVFVRVQFLSGAMAIYRKYIFDLYQSDESWIIYRWQVEHLE